MKRLTLTLMPIPLLLLLVALLILSCAMARHRKYVREGILVTGLNREAFLLEWGPPTKTHAISSDEFRELSINWGFTRDVGSFRKGTTLDVWTYENKNVELVFYGLRLVAWKTEKSVEELKALTPPQKPKP